MSATANLVQMRKRKVSSKTNTDKSNSEKQEKGQNPIRGPGESVRIPSVSMALGCKWL